MASVLAYLSEYNNNAISYVLAYVSEYRNNAMDYVLAYMYVSEYNR